MREARRIPCELYIRGERHSGTVKDISRGGVFIETDAKPPVGVAVTVVFEPAAGRTEIRVAGRVVRSDHRHALRAMQGTIGIGIEVIEMGSLGRLLHDSRSPCRAVLESPGTPES